MSRHTGAKGANPNKRNCGPTALAFVTGKTVAQVMKDMKTIFGGYTYIGSQNWQGRCDTGHMEIMMRHYGQRNATFRRVFRTRSVARWTEAAPRRRYIVRVGNHFAAIYFDDGWRVVDQDGNRPLAHGHKMQRRRVTHVMGVEAC